MANEDILRLTKEVRILTQKVDTLTFSLKEIAEDIGIGMGPKMRFQIRDLFGQLYNISKCLGYGLSTPTIQRIINIENDTDYSKRCTDEIKMALKEIYRGIETQNHRIEKETKEKENSFFGFKGFNFKHEGI